MKLFLCTLISGILWQHVATDTIVKYSCTAGSELFVCTIPDVVYRPESNDTVFKFPAGIKAVRLHYPTRYDFTMRHAITTYDLTLHKLLNNPTSVQLSEAYMESVTIPPDLEYADFRSNQIRSLNVSANLTYALRYLDIGWQYYFDPVNVTTLTNLETLYLCGNGIENVDHLQLTKLTKLKYLSLTDNSIAVFNFRILPPSLETLMLNENHLAELNLNGSHLPALTKLNLMQNVLHTVDVPLLLNSTPAVQFVLIPYNSFSKATLEQITGELTKRNIRYRHHDVVDSVECSPDQELIDGICNDSAATPTVKAFKAAGLITLTLLVTAVFGVVLHWLWLNMKK